MKKILIVIMAVMIGTLAFSETEVYGKWYSSIMVDDFNDTKSPMLGTRSLAENKYGEKVLLMLSEFSSKNVMVMNDDISFNVKEVKVRIDKNKTIVLDNLMGSRNTGFFITDEIVNQMKKGNKILIGTVSTTSENKKYEFSLDGFSEAYKKYKSNLK